jgi:hypothetical protein
MTKEELQSAEKNLGTSFMRDMQEEAERNSGMVVSEDADGNTIVEIDPEQIKDTFSISGEMLRTFLAIYAPAYTAAKVFMPLLDEKCRAFTKKWSKSQDENEKKAA